MKLPTRLVQRAKNPLANVDPLTLPIYETTTFVFDSAEQVCEYNEGKGGKYLYSRYANPTVAAVEETLESLGRDLGDERFSEAARRLAELKSTERRTVEGDDSAVSGPKRGG